MRTKKLGFTLVEVLVVLVIVGVMLGMVTVNFTQDDRQQLQQEAHKLALLLSHASNTARTTGKPIAWSNQSHQYGFYTLADDGRTWHTFLTDSPLRSRELPEGMHIETTKVSGSIQKPGELLIFSPAGLNADFNIQLISKKYDAEILGAQTLIVAIQGDLLGNVIDKPVVERRN